MSGLEDFGEHARGPRDHEIAREHAVARSVDLVGRWLAAPLVSPVDDVVLQEARVVRYLDAGRESLHLVVVLCLLEGLCSMRAVVEGSREHEHDRRSEVLALQVQVVESRILKLLVLGPQLRKGETRSLTMFSVAKA